MPPVPHYPSLTVLLGSGREASNTSKVSGLVVQELEAAGAKVDVIDPRQLQLEVPGLGGPSLAALEQALKDRVQATQGTVLITPEYDGSYSAVMKILIEYLGYPSVLDKQPIMIVGVAAGVIGAARAIEHLRSVCLHIGAYVMPGALSVAGVYKLFDAQGKCQDPGTEAKLRGGARDFLAFVDSFHGR